MEQLLKEWIAAKEEEKAANSKRLKIEKEIIEVLGAPEEGSNTIDKGNFKVTITTRLTRSVDEKKWAVIKDKIPEALRPIETVESLKVLNDGLKWLRDNEPGYYKIVTDVITTKTNKPGVLVKEIVEES